MIILEEIKMSVTKISDSFADLLAGHSMREAKEEDLLGRDSFLKMLIAQLKHQDPLNPMEGTDFSAQLAQFSSLEQLFQMNNTLETVASALGSKGDENMLDYIGKQIMSESDMLRLAEGKVAGGSFSLDKPQQVVISIYDEIGREVITLYPGQLDAGTHQVEWNGYDRTGVLQPDGIYRFELSAVDENGTYTPIKPAISGIVTGVTYENGTPLLEVNGHLVDPATVIKVSSAG